MRTILTVVITLLILASCSRHTESRPLQEYTSAFLNENKNIVAFGKIQMMTLLEKAQYKSVPKFGVVIDQYLKSIQSGLKTKSPIYFALEGPFYEDGSPTTTYGFFEVQNADSLADLLLQQGYDMEDARDFKFHQSGDACFGIRKNLGVILIKKGEFNGEKILKETFERVTNDVSKGKTDQILQAEGDFVLGVHLENLMGTSNTDIKKLSKEKQQELIDLVKDSYLQTNFIFQKGALTVQTKNYFSDALQDKLFFKSDPKASVVSNLGTGSATLGFSMNLDMKKIQSFINDFSPNVLKNLAETMGGEFQMALAMGGKEGLSGILSGELAVVLMGSESKMEGLSDFNAFIGLGKSGKTLAESMKNLLSLSMAKVAIKNGGLAAYSSEKFLPKTDTKINLPKGAEVFGTKGITAFVNFENVDMTQFEFENEQKIIYLLKYVTFEMDENGSKLYLRAKEGKENLLKQAVDVLLKELSAKIN